MAGVMLDELGGPFQPRSSHDPLARTMMWSSRRLCALGVFEIWASETLLGCQGGQAPPAAGVCIQSNFGDCRDHSPMSSVPSISFTAPGS